MSAHFDKTALAGNCYVLRPDDAADTGTGFSAQPVISHADGARMLEQFQLDVSAGCSSPFLAAGDSEVVLFILNGSAQVEISGREYKAGPWSGVQICPQEVFRISANAGAGVKLLLSYCPGDPQIGMATAQVMTTRFNEQLSKRVFSADESRREATGDRYFKVLIGPETGSEQVTLFIGMIPRSRAVEHFHLYEETLCVLSGNGLMWNGEISAPVAPGDILFLPREQPHCMECLDDEGMELVGLFYPAGSPAINYKTEPAQDTTL